MSVCWRAVSNRLHASLDLGDAETCCINAAHLFNQALRFNGYSVDLKKEGACL